MQHRPCLAPLVATLALLLTPACAPDAAPAVARSALSEARPPDPARELVISDPSVIASAEETTFDAREASGTARKGAWSFGRLVHNLLPREQRGSAAAASRLVTRWLATWLVDQSPNPSVGPARARPSVRTLITDPWKMASGCADPANPATDEACVLDMGKAPFRLLAIVYRPDLRIIADDDTAIGGEGRFVFQVVGPTLGVEATSGAVTIMDPTPKAQKFSVIFEYSLPVKANPDTLQWARRFHALGDEPFGPRFNDKLLKVTNDFAGPDADKRRVNGNALNQLRTNEVALQGARFPASGFVAGRQFWELREFHLTSDALAPHTVNQEPARDFDVAKAGQTGTEGTRTGELAAFLTANESAVLASKHDFGALSGNSALVGSAPYGAWGKLVNPNPPAIPAQGVAHDLPGVTIPVRDEFALDTCAGCHRHETDTRHFMHLTALAAMEPSSRVDDRERAGVTPGTSEDAVVLSSFLRAQIGPGGERHDDFVALLAMPPGDLKKGPSRRVCAR